MPISQIVTNSIANAAVGATQTAPTNQFYGFKNRIINGAMMIDQRNAGASVSNANGYTLDRWYLLRGASSSSPVFNVQQSTTAPPNYVNSLLVTIGTSGAPGANNFSGLYQAIEGFNIADLGFGSATASAITLSFWVRSSVTGTFGIAFQNSTPNRSYIATYTINFADTWEQKSITIAGDTTGTWLTNNGRGLTVFWDLGVGTGQSTTAGSWQAGNFLGLTGGTKLSNTASATLNITGVQLEKGSTATSFDVLDYGRVLQQCQRYFEKSFDVDAAPSNGGGATSLSTGNGVTATVCGNNSLAGGPVRFAVPKRTAPTITKYGNNSGYWGYVSSSASSTTNWSANTVLFTHIGTNSFSVIQNVTNNVYYTIYGHWTASAEL